MVPYLVVSSGPLRGSTFLLGERTLIGRCPEADIQVLQTDVSRRHALILKEEDGSLVIGDLDSTNGTFVGGERVADHHLEVGDRIEIGQSCFLFLRARTFDVVVDDLYLDEMRLQKGPVPRARTDGLAAVN